MAEKEKLALYRLWRPQTFDEVVSQKQVVYPLQQSVVEGTFSHALLFSGTRGTGKTSLAKIFAKAINCLSRMMQILVMHVISAAKSIMAR